jgi:hypothetical protein
MELRANQNAPYACKKASAPVPFDGKLDSSVWLHAEKSHRFVDVIGGNPGLYDTRAALVWDDEALHVGFWCEEPFPKATITQRDGLLWFENDLEIFVDGGDTYYEFQLSALNNVYEVFYIWADAYKRDPIYRAQPEFDILENDARVFGGNFDRSGRYFWRGAHPRGNRYAFLNWDFPGLQTAVHIDGALNDPAHPARGWTAQIKLPWAGMKFLAGGRELPPKAGQIWKLFLGRYEMMSINGKDVSVGWSWDPIGTADNHYPELFTPIMLSDEEI